MHTKLVVGLIAAVLVIAGGFTLLTVNKQPSYQYNNTYNPSSSQTQGQTPTSSTGQQPGVSSATGSSTSSGGAQSGYTLAEVSQHNNEQSCWSAIDGKVYDLTSWIYQHPGGAQNILRICGIDGSSAYNAMHGGQRRPESILASFYIGDLAAQ